MFRIAFVTATLAAVLFAGGCAGKSSLGADTPAEAVVASTPAAMLAASMEARGVDTVSSETTIYALGQASSRDLGFALAQAEVAARVAILQYLGKTEMTQRATRIEWRDIARTDDGRYAAKVLVAMPIPTATR